MKSSPLPPARQPAVGHGRSPAERRVPPHVRRRSWIAVAVVVVAVVVVAGLVIARLLSDPTSRTTVTVNDAQVGTSNGTFSYDGDWEVATGPDKHLGDDHYSSTEGSSATLRFRGTSVSLYAAKAPHHGQASVQIDGGREQIIDQYAATRQDDVRVYSSPALPDGDHTLTVTVAGTRNAASTGSVVAIDRAVVSTSASSAAAPTDRAEGSEEREGSGEVVFAVTGDGPDEQPYASTETNDTHPLLYVESGSAPVDRIDGKITKVDSAQFHRMYSTKRFGGPGTTLEISYRARATDIRDRSGSSIVEGAKVGLKFPQDRSITGYPKDDPRSVIGKAPQQPGSYQFLTGLTEGGYMELSRNGYGDKDYKFFDTQSVGYTPGQWKDVTITVEWLSGGDVRVRYWHNADGTGTPVYEVIDSDSPFAEEPGYLWLRTDDTDFEYDYITVEQR